MQDARQRLIKYLASVEKPKETVSPGVQNVANAWQRASILPYEKNDVTGDVRLALPEFINAPLQAAKMPGQVMRGERQVFDPMTGHVNQDIINDSAEIAGAVTLGAGAMPAAKNTLRAGASIPSKKGIRAYHGSPHDFDKFSLDKIGTGEGAQAYGHGLYFADSEDVARSYRDSISASKARSDYSKVNAELPASYKGTDNARRLVGEVESAVDDGDIKSAVEFLKVFEVSPELEKAYRAAIDEVRRKEAAQQAARMYEVNIDASPDDFLDWDKPIKDAPELALSVLGKPADDYTANMPLSSMASLQDPSISKELAEAGIPGIKYLDAGSRASGEGSRNYVVFDDSIVSIVKKYGLVGAVAAGLLTQEQADAYAAQTPRQ